MGRNDEGWAPRRTQTTIAQDSYKVNKIIVRLIPACDGQANELRKEMVAPAAHTDDAYWATDILAFKSSTRRIAELMVSFSLFFSLFASLR